VYIFTPGVSSFTHSVYIFTPRVSSFTHSVYIFTPGVSSFTRSMLYMLRVKLDTLGVKIYTL
jgi:hypothetical protein